MGVICNPAWPGVCCKSSSTPPSAPLPDLWCGEDGFWVPANGETTLLVGKGPDNNFLIQNEVEICAHIQLHSDIILDGAEMIVHGSVDMLGGSTIEIRNGGKLTIDSSCIPTKKRDDASKDWQLILEKDSQIVINGMKWEDGEDAPAAPVHVEGCVSVDGTLVAQNITEIPSGSSEMPFIVSKAGCWGGRYADESEEQAFHTYEDKQDLPGGCSNFHTLRSSDSVDVVWNRKSLCPAQIAGIVVGSVAGAALLAGLAVVALGSAGHDSASAGYVAL